MKDDTVTVALLLGEQDDAHWHPKDFVEGAQRIVRDPNGTITLEDIESEEEFEEVASLSGCFRRGTPIIDPETREVIGYEMEEVPSLKSGTDD
ncbi:MAG TPA: hypothetical protein VIV14_06730 [Gammaproteobacteria bacterium]